MRLGYDLYLGHFKNINDDKSPGFGVEILRQVFATMHQNVSIDTLPTNRLWKMVVRGEREGIFPTVRSGERLQICDFPNEPLTHTSYTLFVRKSDVGKLNFHSIDDLVGHGIVIREVRESVLPPDLQDFFRVHQNLTETDSDTESLRMLAAGHVDYAIMPTRFAPRAIGALGLSGKIEPLPSGDLGQGEDYVCFNKDRVSPAFVTAFSSALKQFKQTDQYRAIFRKYFS